MKEVLMLLLAMIIGFAGGTGMFALILHYCNGNEKHTFIAMFEIFEGTKSQG